LIAARPERVAGGFQNLMFVERARSSHGPIVADID
jgi:hypothetical protein